MRKGDWIRYVGTEDELMASAEYRNHTYLVHKKTGSLIEINRPIRYLDGSIHLSRCSMKAKDFEKVKM